MGEFPSSKAFFFKKDGGFFLWSEGGGSGIVTEAFCQHATGTGKIK